MCLSTSVKQAISSLRQESQRSDYHITLGLSTTDTQPLHPEPGLLGSLYVWITVQTVPAVFCCEERIQNPCIHMYVLAFYAYSMYLVPYTVYFFFFYKGDQSEQKKIVTMSIRPSGLPPIQDMPPPGGFPKVRSLRASA